MEGNVMLTDDQKNDATILLYRYAQELRDLGYNVLPIRGVKFGNAVKIFGSCRRHYNGQTPSGVTIKINEVCWRAADYSLKSTILHELVHAIADTHHHDAAFKKYAAEISRRYGVPIATHADAAEWEAVKTNESVVFPYRVVCKYCGKTYEYLRRAKIIRDIERGKGERWKCPRCGSNVFAVEYADN